MTAHMLQLGIDTSVDVLIVGGGPAGLVAAERLAGRGAGVLLCEEHSTIGTPVHCTGILAAESFEEFDLPRDARLNALTSARFVSPSGTTVTYSTPSPLANVIDRPAFDRALAERAIAAGASLRTGVRVSEVEIGPSGVYALVGEGWVRARLLVLACGANYAMQRRLGLGLPRAYLHTAQCEFPATRRSELELHFGRRIAPDGFAWAVPVSRGADPYVRVGVMTSADVLGCFARMLARVAQRWGIVDDTLPPRQKLLPLGTIARTYGDRLLVVGDAAGLVKPTTGGGIYYSILSGALAAEIGGDALKRDRLDATTLAAYERAWRAQLAEEFDAQHALRAAVSRLSDDDIDELFDLARTDGIMPIVRKTVRFNRHRDLIQALFRHAPSRKLLFRSFAL
jgi:digeranylgeranylglycerophospholipid reductase